MGVKKFINQTGHVLSIELTIRDGDNPPGNEYGIKNFSLAVAQQLLYNYSDDANPYLDGINAQSADGGNLAPGQVYVHTKQDPADYELNTHDTVTLDIQGQAIVLSFSNTGPW